LLEHHGQRDSLTIGTSANPLDPRRGSGEGLRWLRDPEATLGRGPRRSWHPTILCPWRSRRWPGPEQLPARATMVTDLGTGHYTTNPSRTVPCGTTDRHPRRSHGLLHHYPRLLR